MEEITVRARRSIENVCTELYDRALHGEYLFADFNGVRISAYPKLKQEE
jgi:hypothetical protein